MDTRNLEAFLKVCDLGNFTKAAVELGYVQSTVTAQVQQLEQELGYPLFDRLGKRVYLTDLGKQFLPYAAQMLSLARQARSLGKDATQMLGTLRLGVLESLLFTTMAEVLPKYQDMFPLVELEVKMGRTQDLMTWLRENKLDLVYYTSDRTTAPELSCSYCRQEQIVFVAPPNHPLVGRKITPEEFFEQPLLITERSGVCYRRLKDLADARGVVLHHAMEVDNTKLLLELVAQGTGCAFLPGYAVAQAVEAGHLARLNVDTPPEIYFSQIVSPRNKWVPPYQHGLVELIRAARPE